ncbi:MAG: mechanosensitive ion channel protein [Nitratireductor sp.]|nr:mechanosensitive ion channel protein [Nitratireductor sp.]
MVWPVLTLFVSLSVYSTYPELVAVLPHVFDAAAIRLLSGAAAFFSTAWVGGRLVALTLQEVGSRRRPVPRLLSELVSVVLFVIAGVATVILVFGQSISGVLAGSGIFLAILGFAVRNALADVLSGIALALEGPYRLGDWVEIDSQIRGRIVEIGWRTTRLITRDDTYMILPNSQIARQRLTNYSAPRRKYRSSVGMVLGHDVPVAVAKEVLSAAAAMPPNVLASPKPDVKVSAYDPEGIRYTVRFWVPSFAEDVDCKDAVLTAIDKALRDKHLSASSIVSCRCGFPAKETEAAVMHA